MSIQQNINQLTTVGAALYTQTPQYEAKKVAKVNAKEAERLKTESNKSIEAIQKTAQQDLKTAKPSEVKAYMDVMAEHLNKADANIKKAYELNPTPETLRAYIKSKATEYETNDWMRQYDEEMASKANAISEEQMQAMKSQKDRIKSHFENLSTSLGGKVKDLSPELQDTIRRQLEKDGK